MDGALIATIGGLIGVGLGGGLQALQAWMTRAAEAKSVLYALTAEVEALTRLASHRGYQAGILAHYEACRSMIEEGRGGEESPMLVIAWTFNYFSTYDALAPKIGMLDPYFADRITRFYAYAKSLLENYRPGSPFQTPMPASERIGMFENDAILLDTVMKLGIHIGTLNSRPVPAGITDPFAAPPEAGLPQVHPG